MQIPFRTQVISLFCLLSLLLGWQPGLAQESKPQPPVTVPSPRLLTLIPISAGGIQLKVNIVEATATAQADSTELTVNSLFRLDNPSAKEVSVVAALAGYTQTTPAVQDLSIALNDRPASLLSPTGMVPWPRLNATISAKESVTVTVNYRLNLGNGPWVTFRYPITETLAWAGTMNGARVTLSFATGIGQEQILDVAPKPDTATNQRLEWTWQETDPNANPTLTVASVPLWNAVGGARVSATASDANASVHATLGHLYTQLALGPPQALNRYFAQAVAELERAKALDANLVAAYTDLASLYRARAVGDKGQYEPVYLTLWVREVEGARKLGQKNAESTRALAEAYRWLARQAFDGKDWSAAATYLDGLRLLVAAGEVPTDLAQQDEVQRRDSYLQWASAWAATGDLSQARQVLVQGASVAREEPPAIASASQRPAPRFTSWRIEVFTQNGQRRFTLHAQPFLPGIAYQTFASEWRTLSDQLQHAPASISHTLSSVVSAQSGAWLTLTVPFVNGQDLLDRQGQLRQALPNDPDLALLRGVLSPESLTWEQMPGDTPFTHLLRYNEVANLAESGVRNVNVAGDIELWPERLSPDPDPNLVATLQTTFRQASSQAWQTLASDSSVQYQLSFRPDLGYARNRVWYLSAGEKRVLADGQTLIQWPLLGGAVAGVIVLWLLIASWIWRRG